MNKRYLPALLAALLPLLAGCAGDTYTAWGLGLEIRDARTGAPAAYDATVIVRDGDYLEMPLRHSDSAPPKYRTQVELVLAAENRPGTYDVTVTHPDYQTWHRAGIRVPVSGSRNPFSGSAEPEYVHVLVQLQPRDGR